MILYHVSKNENLKIHNNTPMWFTFTEDAALEFGEDFKSDGFYLYKFLCKTDYTDRIVNPVVNNIDNSYVELHKRNSIENYKDNYIGHYETEGGDTQLCLYYPKDYIQLINKSNKKYG